MKNEKGITLISLVITIIVLLILATISINAGTGTIRYSNYNKAKAEMQAMQDNVNSWYDEYANIEVKDEEITAGQTKEDILEEKQGLYIQQYGVAASEPSSCDQTKLNRTLHDVQEKGYTVTAGDFRFLSAQYLKNNIGMDFEYDYLVNIPDRQVILFDGILYDGKKYYTAEDFGILNVEIKEPNSISFDLESGGYTEIIISNLKILDRNLNESDISKFLVEYKKSSDTDWSDATASVIKFTENNQTKFKFSVPEEKAKTETYNVKISTVDKKISKIYSSEVAVNFPYVLASFEANGGTVYTASKLVKINGTYEDLPTPTREGYTFKGWNGKNKFNKEKYFKMEDFEIFDTAYHWAEILLEANKTYKVSVKRYNNFDGKLSVLILAIEKSPGSAGKWTSIAHHLAPNASYATPAFSYLIQENGLLYIGYYNTMTQEYLDTIWENTDVQIEEGEVTTEYEPYYVTADTKVTQNKDHTLTAIWEENS